MECCCDKYQNVEVVLKFCSGQRLEKFEKHDRKSLDFFEQVVSRNLDVNSCAGEGSELREEYGREKLHNLTKYLNHNRQIIGRNKILSAVGEPQKKMRNMLLETGRKGIFVV